MPLSKWCNLFMTYHYVLQVFYGIYVDDCSVYYEITVYVFPV